MELTEQEAVDLTIKMWEDLAVTGNLNKDAWLQKNGYGHIYSDCFLCEFVGGSCDGCPFYLYLGVYCYETPYEGWAGTWGMYREEKALRRKYAKQLLVELYQMRSIMNETNTE